MIVVFFGSFYLINLVLAVVALSYEQEAENIANRVSILFLILLGASKIASHLFCYCGGAQAIYTFA